MSKGVLTYTQSWLTSVGGVSYDDRSFTCPYFYLAWLISILKAPYATTDVVPGFCPALRGSLLGAKTGSGAEAVTELHLASLLYTPSSHKSSTRISLCSVQ